MGATVNIRPAQESDLAQIAQISTHYIMNTVITFSETPPTHEELLSTYRLITETEKLPYLVAVDPQTSDVLGYANAHGFRGAKRAYRHTVEISFFCHPKHTGKGIGPELLIALLNVLRSPTQHPTLRQNSQPEPPVVKQVLAVMAVDETGKKSGLALKEFYERYGFKLNGHLKGVGYKFDRWYAPIAPSHLMQPTYQIISDDYW